MTAPEVQALLQRGQESIDAASDLVARGFFHFGASRAYYAMFYSAQALLLSRGKSFSRHSAVIAAFGREFAEPRLMGTKLRRYFREAFEARQMTGYDRIRKISRETAELTVEQAHEFDNARKSFLSPEGPR